MYRAEKGHIIRLARAGVIARVAVGKKFRYLDPGWAVMVDHISAHKAREQVNRMAQDVLLQHHLLRRSEAAYLLGLSFGFPSRTKKEVQRLVRTGVLSEITRVLVPGEQPCKLYRLSDVMRLVRERDLKTWTNHKIGGWSAKIGPSRTILKRAMEILRSRLPAGTPITAAEIREACLVERARRVEEKAHPEQSR